MSQYIQKYLFDILPFFVYAYLFAFSCVLFAVSLLFTATVGCWLW